MGAKSTFDQSIADSICSQLSDGIPLREICRQEGYPAWRTVYDWMRADTDFAAAIAHARASGYDAIAAECLEIADDGSNDWMERRNADGEVVGEQLNSEHVQRSKLRIETRLKLLAKWDPKRYGEKLAIGGADDLPPIKTMSDEQLAARIKALQSKTDAAKQG